MSKKNRTPALAYLRTSSAANVGGTKDSDKRQSEAIATYAKHAGFEIVDTYYDAAVSGADPIEARPGFTALLDRIEANGVRTVIVEDASRFAREVVTQELGILSLIRRDVRVLTASGDDLTNTQDPFKVAMRQIAGAFAQLEKARLVAKLKHARDRIRQERGKCEGRKSFAEMARANLKDGDSGLADMIAMAKRLRRANPVTHNRMSLRRISRELAAAGYLNSKGKPFGPINSQAMVDGPSPTRQDG
jgi:DNA invertase Pin-like site-specific DNA recombinase